MELLFTFTLLVIRALFIVGFPIDYLTPSVTSPSDHSMQRTAYQDSENPRFRRSHGLKKFLSHLRRETLQRVIARQPTYAQEIGPLLLANSYPSVPLHNSYKFVLQHEPGSHGDVFQYSLAIDPNPLRKISTHLPHGSCAHRQEIAPQLPDIEKGKNESLLPSEIRNENLKPEVTSSERAEESYGSAEAIVFITDEDDEKSRDSFIYNENKFFSQGAIPVETKAVDQTVKDEYAVTEVKNYYEVTTLQEIVILKELTTEEAIEIGANQNGDKVDEGDKQEKNTTIEHEKSQSEQNLRTEEKSNKETPAEISEKTNEPDEQAAAEQTRVTESPEQIKPDIAVEKIENISESNFRQIASKAEDGIIKYDVVEFSTPAADEEIENVEVGPQEKTFSFLHEAENKPVHEPQVEANELPTLQIEVENQTASRPELSFHFFNVKRPDVQDGYEVYETVENEDTETLQTASSSTEQLTILRNVPEDDVNEETTEILKEAQTEISQSNSALEKLKLLGDDSGDAEVDEIPQKENEKQESDAKRDRKLLRNGDKDDLDEVSSSAMLSLDYDFMYLNNLGDTADALQKVLVNDDYKGTSRAEDDSVMMNQVDYGDVMFRMGNITSRVTTTENFEDVETMLPTTDERLQPTEDDTLGMTTTDFIETDSSEYETAQDNTTTNSPLLVSNKTVTDDRQILHFDLDQNTLTASSQISSPDQRRSDILITDDYKDEADKNIMTDSTEPTLQNAEHVGPEAQISFSPETLIQLIPVIVHDLRNQSVSPEEVEALSDLFGKLWPYIQELSNNSDVDIKELFDIKTDSDLQTFLRKKSKLRQNTNNFVQARSDAYLAMPTDKLYDYVDDQQEQIYPEENSDQITENDDDDDDDPMKKSSSLTGHAGENRSGKRLDESWLPQAYYDYQDYVPDDTAVDLQPNFYDEFMRRPYGI